MRVVPCGMRFTADVVRAVLVRKVVLPDIEARSAFFTIKEARAWFPQVIQQQQILSGATVKKPLLRLGITATQQGGFHANQDQEIHWEWDAARVKRCLERLDPSVRAAIEAVPGP